MSDLGCSICQEPFNASAVCVATKCGHVFHKTCVSQWIVNSKTCPSCRAVCNPSALIRIYFTTALADLSMRDLDSVTDKLLATEEKAAKLRKENASLQEKLTRLEGKQKDTKNMVKIMDEMNKRKDHLMMVQASQLKDYQATKARADALSVQVKELSAKVTQMSKIETVLNSSAKDADELVSRETCLKTLAFLVVNLKRELSSAEAKKSEMFSNNCCLNNQVKSQSNTIDTMQDKLNSLETEFLTIQRQLRNRMKEAADEKRSSINRLSVGSSSAATPHSTPTTPASSSSSSATAAISPISEEKSDSPYLRLASSSVGLTPLLRTNKVQVLEDRPKLNGNLQKLSIFSKPQQVRTAVAKPPTMNSIQIGALMKENIVASSSSSTRPVLTAGGLVPKSDRFKIENRLKSGVLKRPAPYSANK